ncbi:MAG TPA: permease, partial [Anaeromyxobacteraceae bacterium]|nr:permease [Anaeromyxobacteraceae bacterium]
MSTEPGGTSTVPAQSNEVLAGSPPASSLRLVGQLALALAIWITAYRIIQPAADLVTSRVLGLDARTRLGSAVAFFLFEAPKVLLLLTLVVFAVGIVRSFFTPERTRAILSGRRESAGHVLAAFLGVVTPFCSCSAVPLFLGFVEVGIPLGVTLSFLISAPMVNEVALVLLFGLFGWKVAAIYMGTGLALAIGAGWILGVLKLERWVEPWVFESLGGAGVIEEERLTFSERVGQGAQAVREIVGKVWPYVLAGIAVGAGIHGYVPEGLMAGIMGKHAWWSVPVAVA